VSATNLQGWRETVIRYAPLFLWIGVIFYLSSESGSMEQTSRFIRPLLRWIFPFEPEETITLYHGYVRKCAHFTEYAVLALLAVRAFAGSLRLRRFRFVLPVILAGVIASIDEVNQSFLSARSGSAWDVLLDISGSLSMVAILAILGWPKRSE
jgi:VanZ family protein